MVRFTDKAREFWLEQSLDKGTVGQEFRGKALESATYSRFLRDIAKSLMIPAIMQTGNGNYSSARVEYEHFCRQLGIQHK